MTDYEKLFASALRVSRAFTEWSTTRDMFPSDEMLDALGELDLLVNPDQTTDDEDEPAADVVR